MSETIGEISAVFEIIGADPLREDPEEVVQLLVDLYEEDQSVGNIRRSVTIRLVSAEWEDRR